MFNVFLDFNGSNKNGPTRNRPLNSDENRPRNSDDGVLSTGCSGADSRAGTGWAASIDSWCERQEKEGEGGGVDVDGHDDGNDSVLSSCGNWPDISDPHLNGSQDGDDESLSETGSTLGTLEAGGPGSASISVGGSLKGESGTSTLHRSVSGFSDTSQKQTTAGASAYGNIGISCSVTDDENNDRFEVADRVNVHSADILRQRKLKTSTPHAAQTSRRAMQGATRTHRVIQKRRAQ